MIVRFGGGNSGIAEYLENGLKYNRHYSRDELDNRIIIDGDLDITDKIINEIPDNNQERYLHITLSFNEPDITVDKMEAAYEDYKKLFLSAYKEGEINTYAEIHQPKTKQLLDKSTQKMYERFPHIHMVIPKRNLLTGGYTNPAGINLRHVNIWEAIQEKVNNDHGLNSPALSPRISLENYKAVLDRHKLSEFKQSKAGKVKAELFDTIEVSNVRTWNEFKAVVSNYGEIKIRNEGKDTEYYAVKLPDNPKFTNLNSPIFSKQYIENREIPRKPLSQYQINNRLKQWEVLSREIKYIDDASAAVKKAYRALDTEKKSDFLKKHEASFYENHEISESEYASNRFRQSDFEYRGSAPTERRSLHELPVLELVHSGASRHGLDRAELLLSDDSSGGLQFNKANSDAGLQRPVHRAERRIISDKTQIKSLTSQIIFNIEENAAITKDNDLELFKEIRTHLNPELVLAYAQASHLANIEDHSFYRVKDGSARISFGKYNYNVSDFFTKGLGLEWSETQVILKSLYDAQKEGLEVKTISNDELKKHLINFEDDVYSDKLEQYKRVTNSIGRDESLSFKKITNNYFNEIKRINGLSHLTYKEKQNLKAINVYEKLVAEEYLKAVMYESKQSAYAIKYPFSDHFKNYLIKEQVLDMTLIDRMKNKYLKKPRNQELENSISGKGYDHVLNGKEAARRARLIANMARQNQQLLNNRYGYTFRELRPEQQKDHVVFFKEDKKLFETDSNKTKVLGKPEINAVATALAYSLSRYGNPLEITGTEEFRGQLIEAAARNGLEVEFTDPTLNEALKDKLAEIDLEQASENSISAPDLALDPSLSESTAVDKALLESKQREIEADLKEPNQEALDLGAIAINQRFNAHYYEPVTAETAIKDIALYKELNQSPALQAYFAVEMMKVGAVNADYRAEFIKNEPEEFMLANHAARQFTGELEAAYQANKPQEEFGLNLEKVLLEIEELNQEEIKLRAEISPLLLDSGRYYNPEFRINSPETEEMQPLEVIESKLKDAEKRLNEVLIKKRDLEQSVALAEIDEQESDSPTIKEALDDLEVRTNNATTEELQKAAELFAPFEQQTTNQLDAANAPTMEQLAQELEDSTYSINSGFSQEIADLESGAKSTMTIEHSDPKGNHIYLQKTGNGWQVSLSNDGVDFSDVYEDEIIPPHYADFQTDNLYDAVKNMVERVAEEQQNYEHSSEQKEIADEIQQAEATLNSFQAEIQYQKERLETFNTRLEELQQDISDLRNDPEMEGEKVYLQKEMEDINLAIEQTSKQLEAAENGFVSAQQNIQVEPEVTPEVLDEMGVPDATQPFVEAEAVQHFVDQMESVQHMQSTDGTKTLLEQVEALEAGDSKSLSFKASDENETTITLEKTENGWQVLKSDDPVEYQVFQSDNLNDALHNVLERAEKVDHEIEQNQEWQKNEEKAQQSEEVEVIPERFSLETQNHISRLENSDLYHISNSSKTLTEWFIEVETGAESYLAIESGDHDQQYIALEKTESGYLVRQGDAYLSASDFTEEDCPPEYKVFETSSLEAAIENMAERESRFTMTEELEAAGKADRKLEFGLDDDEKTQIIETEPEAIEPKTQVQQQEKPASLASDTEQESPEKSNFSEVGLVRLGDGIDLPEQVAGATLDGLVDGFKEGSKLEDKAPEVAPNQADNQKKQPNSKLEKDLVDEMGVVEVDLPVQVGAAAIGGVVAGFKAAYSSDDKWDNKVKDQAGLTEASYNTRVAANNLDDIPEQIKDNNSLLRTYKEVITEQLDSKLLSSEDQTKAENLLSNTELQMHNNVMELIPEELTDVREKMQAEFDSSRKEDSPVGFEELLLANKEMLMRDLNIDIESQGEVNQVESEASDRLDDVKAKTLESFKATPEPLNEANAGTKHLANTIVAFSAPATAAEASETAKGIHDGLSQLQGTPELKEAALAAVELIDNNPELKNAMMELSNTSDGTTEAIIETARDVSKDIEIETPSNDFDM